MYNIVMLDSCTVCGKISRKNKLVLCGWTTTGVMSLVYDLKSHIRIFSGVTMTADGYIHSMKQLPLHLK